MGKEESDLTHKSRFRFGGRWEVPCGPSVGLRAMTGDSEVTLGTNPNFRLADVKE